MTGTDLQQTDSTQMDFDPAAAWGALETETNEASGTVYKKPPKHYRPFADAAERFITEAQQTKRFYTGIPQFDAEMRGLSPGHLGVVVGYCMTPDHEVLTDSGWKNLDTIDPSDRLWTVNPDTQTGEWDDCLDLHIFDHDGPLNRLVGKNIDAFVTDNHKWAVRSQHSDKLKVKTTDDLNSSDYIPCAIVGAENGDETLSDPYLRILAWIFTEGTYQGNSVTIYQSPSANPDKCDMIEKDLADLGWDHSIYARTRDSGCAENAYRIKTAHGRSIVTEFPNKMATTELVDAMSVRQRRMFIDTLILGDGYVANENGTRRYVTTRDDEAAVTAHLFAAAGVAFSQRWRTWTTPYGQCEMHIFTERTSQNVRYARLTHSQEHYTGKVWCPETRNGIILARRDGKVFYTHNSHSGKTQLVLHMLRNNRLANIAYFCPDEPAPLVLTKLTSLTHNIPARELEEKVGSGDREAITLLRQTAEEEFPNLIVFDKPLTTSVLNDGYKEACDVWGAAADINIVDYVDLVQGPEVVPQKFDILKSFVSVNETAMWAIHQTSRSGGAEGKAMTISSGNYGGEQHATMMIGVRRKKSALMAELAEQRVKQLRNPTDTVAQKIVELEYEMSIAEFTLTANVVKNKRPGGALVDELDFEIAMSTGQIFQLADGALPQQWLRRNQPATEPASTTLTEEEELWAA